MFHLLSQLLSQFCQFPISPGRTRQRRTANIKVNPTQLSDQMAHPVVWSYADNISIASFRESHVDELLMELLLLLVILPAVQDQNHTREWLKNCIKGK